MAKFVDKVVLVTGGSRGLGKAMSLGFASEGAKVIIVSRKQQNCTELAEQIIQQGGQAEGIAANAGKTEDIDQLVEQVSAKYGAVDILVNNAGGFPPKPALKTSLDEFEAAFRFNVSTALACSQLAIPKMIETAGEGSIINISSIAGQEPCSQFAAYGVAKSSLSFLTKELAQEFAPKIRVNAIGVGSTKTEALKTVLNDEVEKTMVDLTPMARLGEVEDISACALYLASPASAYLTGDIIQVNGGLNSLNMKMPRAFD